MTHLYAYYLCCSSKIRMNSNALLSTSKSNPIENLYRLEFRVRISILLIVLERNQDKENYVSFEKIDRTNFINQSYLYE